MELRLEPSLRLLQLCPKCGGQITDPPHNCRRKAHVLAYMQAAKIQGPWTKVADMFQTKRKELR
jgi:hypothetical protein